MVSGADLCFEVVVMMVAFLVMGFSLFSLFFFEPKLLARAQAIKWFVTYRLVAWLSFACEVWAGPTLNP